jgi:Putative zinc-finger
MESRVTSFIAAGRAESGRGSQRLGPDSGSASGRIAVTKADEGVAPTPSGTSHIGTPSSTGGSVGVAELTHELVRGQLSEYLDDALGEATRRRIDGHLAGCPPCVAYLDTLRVTVRALGQLPAPKAPPGARARIVDQARREHGAPRADA